MSKPKTPFTKRRTSKGQVSGRVFPVKKTKSQSVKEALKARLKAIKKALKKK